MKLAVLFSGGKDSAFAAYLAKQAGHDLIALVTIVSRNPDSYMFHTPAISCAPRQAELMGVPLIEQETRGEQEVELADLREALVRAKQAGAGGVVTGAVASVYQASRIQKLCFELGLEVFNPLWQIDQVKLLNELVDAKFRIIIAAIAAYPLDVSWLGREIDGRFIEEVAELERLHGFNPAGEGGEFESLVLDCPLFKEPLVLVESEVVGDGHAARLEVRCADR